MPIRAALTKVSAQGEQIVVDVCQWNPVTGEIVHQSVDEMTESMNAMLGVADIRLLEMNTRMLEAYDLESYFAPGEWQKVVAILDILCGRQSAEYVKQRWDAIREENAALEAGRLTQMQCTSSNELFEACPVHESE